MAKTALERSPIFGDLPRGAIDRLAGSVRLEEFKAPTLLSAAGEHIAYLRYVISGHLVLRIIAPSSASVEASSVGPGQWRHWGPVFGNTTTGRDLWSSANATFLAFPGETAREIAMEYPGIFPKVISEISKRHGAALNIIFQSGFGSDEKILAQLLLMSCKLSDNQTNIVVTSTHEGLGKLTGISRKKVGRILKTLEADNLIESGYGTITVLDQERLQAFVDQSDLPLV